MDHINKQNIEQGKGRQSDEIKILPLPRLHMLDPLLGPHRPQWIFFGTRVASWGGGLCKTI